MPDLLPLERLQPSLLDRLTDDEPGNLREPLERRIFSIRRLRESVLRDLGWLLNTTNMSHRDDIDRYEEAVGSVINYGIVDLAGMTSTSIDAKDLASQVRAAIVRFEPRLLHESLIVEAEIDHDSMAHNTLRMRVEGELWAVPAPLRILINTAFDLESGSVVISERSFA